MTPKMLQLAKTVFLCCDIQEKLAKTIYKFSNVVSTARNMMRVGSILDIPMIVTEQYPKGLGRTVADIDISCGKFFEKNQFSMMTEPVRA